MQIFSTLLSGRFIASPGHWRVGVRAAEFSNQPMAGTRGLRLRATRDCQRARLVSSALLLLPPHPIGYGRLWKRKTVVFFVPIMAARPGRGLMKKDVCANAPGITLASMPIRKVPTR